MSFFKILNKDKKTLDDNLKLSVNSFGNNRINYLYNKKNSDFKYNLAMEIINNHDTFENYRKTETYLKSRKAFEGQTYKTRMHPLERIQQLQQLQQLERLQNININSLEITNHDYKRFSYLSDAIIYLDPPYEKTHLNGYSINNFDSKSFYDWAYGMSNKNIVLISSYEISDERFECVYEFKNARNTFSPKSCRGIESEKLFMVKKGEK